MAQEDNVVHFPNATRDRLRVDAQTSALVHLLLAEIPDDPHYAGCAKRLGELMRLFDPFLTAIEGSQELITELALTPAAERIDRIADHLTQHLDAAGATPLPEVPAHDDDPAVVRVYVERAAIILRYTLYVQTVCVMSRRLAS
jgi:hypothetical protein